MAEGGGDQADDMVDYNLMQHYPHYKNATRHSTASPASSKRHTPTFFNDYHSHHSLGQCDVVTLFVQIDKSHGGYCYPCLSC